ncbi:MAG: VOC family protein [Saprospiraceae bacterium]|nr:VOC family protein [Saprospiraceae bacterium]
MIKPELLFTKIQHLGIPVTDLSRSIPFYQNLGFQLVMDSPFDHQEGQGRCIMMQKIEILLELYQFPLSTLESIRTRRDGHIDHIAFDVPDIDQAFEVLSQNGFIPLESSPVFLPFWARGCRFFNILGPDGERLEFNQIL